jgi:hypothetical protein
MARPPSTGFYSADISIGSSIVADRTSHFIKKQAISGFGEVCITGDEIFAQRCFGGFAEEGGKTVNEAPALHQGEIAGREMAVEVGHEGMHLHARRDHALAAA